MTYCLRGFRAKEWTGPKVARFTRWSCNCSCGITPLHHVDKVLIDVFINGVIGNKDNIPMMVWC